MSAPAPRHQPPWWPENEPWPPQHAWHGGPPWMWRGHRPFLWRLGGIFTLLVLVVLLGAAWSLGQALGSPEPPGGRTPFRWLFPVGFILFVVFAGVVSARGVRRLAQPLDSLLRAAQRVEAGDYTARVPTQQRGPRELRHLVGAFNTMTERLQADEGARRALLADVSHELRTPLAVIRGQVEAILDGVHPADPQHLGAVLDEVQVMTRLVEDLRTLALSEGGTLALHREPTDVALLVTEVAQAFAGVAAGVGVTLAVEASADLPLLNADPVRLREVLENLVANALRHTPAGGAVRLRAAVAGGTVVLNVADTGVGIPPELLPRVFDRFVKGGGSGGSGLGLAIARHLVEAHGGTLRAESAPGQGATFTVTLPLAAMSG